MWPLSGATVTPCRRGTVALTSGDLEFGVAVRVVEARRLFVCLFWDGCKEGAEEERV